MTTISTRDSLILAQYRMVIVGTTLRLFSEILGSLAFFALVGESDGISERVTT